MSAVSLWVLGCLLACGGSAPAPAPGALPATWALDGRWASPRSQVQVPDTQAREAIVLRHSLVLPEDWAADTPAVLHVDGAAWQVAVSLDGRAIGRVAGGLWPLSLDLTGQLRGGRQELSLEFIGARSDNVWPGHRVGSVLSWTGVGERPGLTRRRGSVWLELPGERPLGPPVITTRGDQVTVAVAAPGRDGEALSLDVVRDGEALQSTTRATVREGRAEFQFRWRGPRWTLGGSPEPFLQHAVVRASDGTSRQVRFGVRDVQVVEGRLVLEGDPFYLVGQRYVPGRLGPREGMVRHAAWLARLGGNTAELHGAVHDDRALQAADELGLPVTLVPRCAGPGRSEQATQGPEAAARSAWFLAGNALLSDARRHHPALILWAEEEVGVDGFMDVFADSGVPVVAGRDSQGLTEQKVINGLPPGRAARYINEMPWALGTVDELPLAERLGQTLGPHVRWALGAILPLLDPHPRRSQVREPAALVLADQVHGLLDRLGTPQYALGDRRGPAELVVSVRTADGVVDGLPVVLEVPRQPALGAFTDAAGQAWFSVDAAGPAQVRLLGQDAGVAVTLESGRYTDGQWVPSVAQAVLGP